jgi:hypothetical protein
MNLNFWIRNWKKPDKYQYGLVDKLFIEYILRYRGYDGSGAVPSWNIWGGRSFGVIWSSGIGSDVCGCDLQVTFERRGRVWYLCFRLFLVFRWMVCVRLSTPPPSTVPVWYSNEPIRYSGVFDPAAMARTDAIGQTPRKIYLSGLL